MASLTTMRKCGLYDNCIETLSLKLNFSCFATLVAPTLLFFLLQSKSFTSCNYCSGLIFKSQITFVPFDFVKTNSRPLLIYAHIVHLFGSSFNSFSSILSLLLALFVFADYTHFVFSLYCSQCSNTSFLFCFHHQTEMALENSYHYFSPVLPSTLSSLSAATDQTFIYFDHIFTPLLSSTTAATTCCFSCPNDSSTLCSVAPQQQQC